MQPQTNYLKLITLTALVISFAYMFFYTKVHSESIVLTGAVILCHVLSYFPSKLNYPGKVTEQNKKQLYALAQSLLAQVAFILSLMVVVLSFQIYTTLFLSILVGLLLLVTIRSVVMMYRHVD